MSEINGGTGPLDHPHRWPSLLERMVSAAVLPGDRPDVVRTKRLFAAAVWASIATSIISMYQMWFFGAPWGAVALGVPLLSAAVALTSIWLRSDTFPAVMHVVAGGTMITTGAVIVIFGGVFETAGNTVWAMLVVVGAVAIFADRRAHFWLATFVMTTLGASVISSQVDPLYELPYGEYLALFNLLVVCVFIYAILYFFVRQTSRLYRESERLLRNILPDEIADRLKASQGMIADDFDSASILFADLAGFTKLVANLEPTETINLLNDVFTVFDDMVEERGLEKIKTIGDAYMVASGVPVPRDDHARAICDLALDMLGHLESSMFAGRHLEMRIGIASGPVAAGIIGRQKFSYDLWGDTVNLASRMESTGAPGRIQMPAATRMLVAPWFVWEERGMVDVKGRGPIGTWFLTGRAVER